MAFKLLVSQDDEWLRLQRAAVGSSSVFGGLTLTRAGPGYPLRWGANWLEAVGDVCGGWENAERVAERTTAKASLLTDWLKGYRF